jgi:histone deacetylase 11
MTLGTVGSVEASYLAMQKGWAINLSGGFHHASRSHGEGFCIFPDITFCTHYLRQIYLVKKIMIIDLDAHQGNGHEIDHLNDVNTFIMDAYNHRIYPGDKKAKAAIKCDINVSYSTTDEQFLRDLETSMETSFRDF